MTHTMAASLDLTPDNQEVLRACLRLRPRGLFTDIDGTISPIAPTPDAAELLPGIAELLAEARGIFDIVAVVSGRSPRDRRRLVNVPGLVYIGNHGFERLEPIPHILEEAESKVQVLPAAQSFERAVNEVLNEAAQKLERHLPGVLIERKGITGSVHVRNTPNPDIAETIVADILTAAARPYGLRITRGKRVVEVRPPIKVDKGTTVSELIRFLDLRSAIYLGDDRTDMDAFRALRQLTKEGACWGISVGVLHHEVPPGLIEEADMTLTGVEQVPTLLRWLLINA